MRRAIVQIPRADAYRFGDSNSARPVLRDLAWTVNENESWAVIGSGSGEKSLLFEVCNSAPKNSRPHPSLQTLLGNLRLLPPPPHPGLLPAFSHRKAVSLVSFGHRKHSSGAFYDYSARYGAVRDEDKITLRQNMFPETIPRERFAVEEEGVQLSLQAEPASHDLTSAQDLALFDEISHQVGLDSLLDLPLVALSNGQMRKARILKAILRKPHLLLLDEPLSVLPL